MINMEQILIDNGFKHIRTVGNKKEYEKIIDVHKMRVRPSLKSVYIEYELMNKKYDIKTVRITEEEAIKVIEAFIVMEIILNT